MKRRLTDTELRDLVRARITKGDAFRYGNTDQYLFKQQEVKDRLEALSRDAILKQYPHVTHDVKR